MKDNNKLLTIIILSALAGAGIAYLLSTEKGKELMTKLKEKAEAMLNDAHNKIEVEVNELIEKLKASIAEEAAE